MRFEVQSIDANNLELLRSIAETKDVIGILTKDKQILHCKILSFKNKRVHAHVMNLHKGRSDEKSIPTDEIIGFFPSLLESFLEVLKIEVGTFAFGAELMYKHPFRRDLLKDKPLYIDWDWLHRTTGGINSIGGGFMISGSVGWKSSLFKMFWNKLKKLELVTLKEIDAGDLHSEFRFKASEVRVYLNRNWRLSMEGTDWYKGFSKVANDSILLCYFRTGDAFLYPLKWLKHIPGPFMLWGELIPTGKPIKIVGVLKPYFVKVRGMATT